jgi:putative transposase
MRKGRYTEEQIVYALRQVEQGAPLTQICRRMGVSPTTFYVWKKRFAGMGVADVRKTKQLEDEVRRLLRGAHGDLQGPVRLHHPRSRSAPDRALQRDGAPTARWTAHQISEALPWKAVPRHLLSSSTSGSCGGSSATTSSTAIAGGAIARSRWTVLRLGLCKDPSTGMSWRSRKLAASTGTTSDAGAKVRLQPRSRWPPALHLRWPPRLRLAS